MLYKFIKACYNSFAQNKVISEYACYKDCCHFLVSQCYISPICLFTIIKYCRDAIEFFLIVTIKQNSCSPLKVEGAGLMMLTHLLVFHFLITLIIEIFLENMEPSFLLQTELTVYIRMLGQGFSHGEQQQGRYWIFLSLSVN